MPEKPSTFPQDFIWGAATASYQVEGAARSYGRGKCVWDMFCSEPGNTFEGDDGTVACDHYHRLEEDLDLMARIGLRGYRFSFSWPRLIPEGVGAINPEGLAFYDRLVDGLLARGIQPWATLFHWDYPYALFLKGGWLNPESPRWFADYTRTVVDHFSDRVQNWMTLNEPQCFIELGHHEGQHAPGLRLGLREVLQASHHVLLAHGRAVEVIREYAKSTPRVGWAPVGHGVIPASDSPADIEAARQVTFAVEEERLWNTAWWSDAAILGHYPEAGLRRYGRALPNFPSSDFATIKQPLDFHGSNLYNGQVYRMGDDGPEVVKRHQGYPQSTYNWKMEPGVMYWVTRFIYERYKLPLVITENGTATTDWVELDGSVNDYARIDFTRRYLLELRRASSSGLPILGYFYWSLMDNFEWQKGFSIRMGLIHVDYRDGTRTPKESANWYQQVIQTNGANL
ncbi:MAG: GH1 family beta-glucosidase [Puniceicoccaceae bacterium]